jgi:hypothetical protein
VATSCKLRLLDDFAITRSNSTLQYGELAVADAEETDAAEGAGSFVLPYLQQGYSLFLREHDDELAALKATMSEAFGACRPSLLVRAPCCFAALFCFTFL